MDKVSLRTQDGLLTDGGRGCSGCTWMLLALLIVVSSSLLTEVLLYSRNVLTHHPEWVLGKALLGDSASMGWHEAGQTRNLLAGNRLCLNAWHGFHEVLFHRPIRFQRARFRFRLDPAAYLIVVLARNDTGFSGVRLSRDRDRPTLFFRADAGGRFLETRALDLEVASGWQTAEVGVADGLVSVQLNGVTSRLFLDPNEPRVFGFRGGFHGVQVDDVELFDTTGAVLAEDFRNDRHYGRVLFASALGLVLVTGLGLTLAAARRAFRRALLWAITGHVALSGVLALYLGFDYFFWSTRYPYEETGGEDLVFSARCTPFENGRRAFFETLSSLDPASPPAPDTLADFLGAVPSSMPDERTRLGVQLIGGSTGETTWIDDAPGSVREYLARVDKPDVAILFLGTSQTWGEGAGKRLDGMVAQAHRVLAAAHPDLDLWTLNAARQGTNSAGLWSRLQDHLLLFEPDLVVVNLANNDADPEVLIGNLERMAALDMARGIKTLFVLEGNSPETGSTIRERHRAMMGLGGRLGVPCLDLHAHLASPGMLNSGLLWWDEVHPTTYGHRVAGEFLAHGIEQHFFRLLSGP